MFLILEAEIQENPDLYLHVDSILILYVTREN